MNLLERRVAEAKAQRQELENQTLLEVITRQIAVDDAENERAAAAERQRILEARAKFHARLQPASILVAEQVAEAIAAHDALLLLYSEAEQQHIGLSAHVLTPQINRLRDALAGFLVDTARAGLLDKAANARQQRLDQAAELRWPQASASGPPAHPGKFVNDRGIWGFTKPEDKQ